MKKINKKTRSFTLGTTLVQEYALVVNNLLLYYLSYKIFIVVLFVVKIQNKK
jgi:hypothetical protein